MYTLEAHMKITLILLVMALASGCSNTKQPDTPESNKLPATSPQLTNKIKLNTGLIEGNQPEPDLKEFLGIPFAAPPMDALRWQPPQPADSWTGVRDASTRGLPCIQPTSLSPFYHRSYPQTSEDCLTLNVWTRAASEGDNLPVMVWVHGGALIMGSGADYDGAKLTAKGVVLVTINYRLGPFGFFAHPELTKQSEHGSSGNQGYKDQIAALQWVRDNIRAFGGNPDNVTIFGESAGSWSMSVLQASPSARGLFHKVIGQSGARLLPLSNLKTASNGFVSAEQRGLTLAKLFSGDAAPSMAQLQALPAEQIMAAYAADPAVLNNFDALTIVDGEVLPEEVNTIFAKGEQANVPVMIGSNALEASTFDPGMFVPAKSNNLDYANLLNAQVTQMLPAVDSALLNYYPTPDPSAARQAWINFNTDVSFTQPMNLWAEHMLKQTSPAYLYWWDWQPSIKGSRQYGAFHAAEIPYVFGNLDTFDIDITPQDEEFSNLMMDIWTQFAKTSNPSIQGVLDWPAYTAEDHQTVVIGENLSVSKGVRLPQVKLITEAYDRNRE